MDKFLMDAHMHFDLYKNRESVLDYIENNKSYTIAVTNLPELYERYYLKYRSYKYIRFALGFHPELAYEYQAQINKFQELLSTTRYIGEIGLDFTTTDLTNRSTQETIFQDIIRMCNTESNKILSVHSRRAEKKCMDILSNFNGEVILHWYTGNKTNLQEAIDRGYYFSVNHQMTLSNSGRSTIAAIPLNHILLETDAPFSKWTRSEYTVDLQNMTYSFLSNIHNMGISDVSKIVKNNFKSLLSHC